MSLRKRHQKTLETIFARPTRATVRHDDVVTLIKALGGEVIKSREGSRVAFRLNGRIQVVHRPHPGSEISKATVEDVRDFLINAGVLL